MPRRPDPSPDALSPRTLDALAGLPGNSVFRALAHADAAFPRLIELTASLWNDAALSARHRELAILRVARLVDCDYEWMHHVEVARMVGIGEHEIAALDRGDLADFAGADRAVLDAVPAMLARRRTDDALFDVLDEALTTRGVVELHLVVGVYAAIAAVVADLDVDPDPRSGAFELEPGDDGPRLGAA